jgi:membrane protein DedA with SNARE-associated domain
MISELIKGLIDFLVNTIGSLGYLGIFILMAFESSVVPIPSELVLPPAGVLIAHGKMSFWLVLLSSVLGGIVGALASYFIALYLGRRVIEKLISRYGSVLLLTNQKLEKVDYYFKSYGQITIFISRLIPVVRHLISLPAGFSRMNLTKFILYTALGSGIWSVILIYLGYFYGTNVNIINQNLNLITYVIGGLCLIIGFFYYIFKKRSKKD